MRPVLLSWSDSLGGAARATARLQRALRLSGVDARMVVARKGSEDECVNGPMGIVDKMLATIGPRVDQWPARRYGNRRSFPFSSAWLPDTIPRRLRGMQCDVVHLHWVNFGFLKIETLRRIGAPLVWTWHDMWPATGGCHYSEGCERWQASCGECPLLGSKTQKDLSYRTKLRKRHAWQDCPIAIIAPSRWIGGIASRSPLFRGSRIEVIPNCIDLDCFRPVDKAAARQALGLPLDRRLVMFAAMDPGSEPRKGFPQLAAALSLLSSEQPADLVIAGSGTAPPGIGNRRVHLLGRIGDDARMTSAYSAADVFVAPSTEDNLPNTVMEALACGVPCVAFDVGGMPDLIQHGVSGYLARPGDVADLAHGIEGLLESDSLRQASSHAARQHAERCYSPAVVARQHSDLYAELLASSGIPGTQ